jgi:ribonuclease HI
VGGYGAVLLAPVKDRVQVLEIAGAEVDSTNNRMEMMGALEALRSLKKPVKATLYSDSQYVVKGMSIWVKNWLHVCPRLSHKANSDLWLEMLEVSKPHRITWQWVRGHAGIRWNERADVLAGQAITELHRAGRPKTWRMKGKRYVVQASLTP